MASSSQQPITLRTDNSGFGDPEIVRLIEEVQGGDFKGLRDYLSTTRGSGDWQDRIYNLKRVAPKVSIDALDAACSAEPEAADLRVIRCAYYAELAGTMRGTGTADQVGGARFQNSADCVKAAMNDMTRSTELDDQDPTAYTLVLWPLTIFSQAELQMKLFAKATAIAPDLVPAHFAITTALSERWGGSHVASLTFAREAMTKAGPGSDMAACLFWAHTLVRGHFIYFDKDEPAGKRYGLHPVVTNELNDALDNWLVPSFVPNRSSLSNLRQASAWYRAVMDMDRLKRVIALTGEGLNLPTKNQTATNRTNASRRGGLLSRLFGKW